MNSNNFEDISKIEFVEKLFFFLCLDTNAGINFHICPRH